MKKFFLVFSFAFLFFLTPFDVSASVYPDLPQIYSNQDYIVFKELGNTRVSILPSGLKYYISGSSSLRSSGTGKVYLYDLVGNSWVLNTQFSITTGVTIAVTDEVFANSFDIYKDNTYSDVAIKKNLLRTPTELELAVQTAPMEKVLEIVLEVLPIVVLSIISYLGLRKAFRWLLLQLKGC